jgi:pimeloyl-ACP methyl ester carboxylesterase
MDTTTDPRLEVRHHPAGTADRPGVLCIPGAFHDAACWDAHWLPFLAARGVDARALSLRGHGASAGHEGLQRAGLDAYAEDVERVLDAADRPLVLVGHSMGGVIAERVFARRRDVAGLVLVACSPLRVPPLVALRLLLRQPPAVVRGLIGKDPAAARPAFCEFFFSDALPDADRARYVAALGDESQRAVGEVFARDALVRAADDDRPALVLAGRGDWSIPRRAHERLARAWDAPLEWCDGAHDLMLDAPWQDAAGRLLEWCDARFPAADAAR